MSSTTTTTKTGTNTCDGVQVKWSLEQTKVDDKVQSAKLTATVQCEPEDCRAHIYYALTSRDSYKRAIDGLRLSQNVEMDAMPGQAGKSLMTAAYTRAG